MSAPVEDLSKLTRRERRKREVRNRIIEAAVELFDRDGFAATRVAAICDRADVAHKTFFNHFPAKQDLLREMASVYLAGLLERLEETRKQPGTTGDRITFFFDRVAENACEIGSMHRELITEVVHVIHESGTETEQAQKLQNAFGAIIAEGVARGDITTDHPPETLTDMMMGAFYALMFNWSNLDHYPIAQHASATARFLADAMSAKV
ncbi:MAG: TetR/AcrR family transcriptional regulator [Myxococcota bacterium]|jgi:AcrR family transcriptional regulator|nr:TetR/AcrR family transcriptional regulator [Myxococcota bacterium]